MLILELQPRVLIALNLPSFLLPCPFLVHFCLNSALPTCLLFANHLNSSLSFFFYPIKNLSSIMEITRFKQKVAQEALSDWKKNLFWRRLAILAKIISNFLSKTAKKSICLCQCCDQNFAIRTNRAGTFFPLLPHFCPIFFSADLILPVEQFYQASASWLLKTRIIVEVLWEACLIKLTANKAYKVCEISM